MNGSKNWYIYVMEYCVPERKKELLPFATAWIDPKSIMLSEISQAVKDKYHFEFILVCDIRRWSNFLFLCISVQFS